MRRIITIQHTQSEQHTNGMIGSWADWDLTSHGIESAELIGKMLKEELIEDNYVLFSSDLLRAKHTAMIVSNHLGIEPKYNQLLREFNLGIAVGKTKKWAKENIECPTWPKMFDWAKTKDGKVFAEAETRIDVWNRINTFYKEVIEKTSENIIIVSHEGWLSMFFAFYLGLDLNLLDKTYISGKSGGVSIMEEDSEGNHKLLKLNDTSYLKYK